MALDIEQVDPSIGGSGSFNPGEVVPVDTNNIIYFKDITPSHKESDYVEQTNLTRLKELLLSGGFSNAYVDEISTGKIVKQYEDRGPILKGKGELYVEAVGLNYLKCKDKNKSYFHGCRDLYSSGYILLNTNASDDVDGKWIYISELGFGIEKDKTFFGNDMNGNFKKLIPPHRGVSYDNVDTSLVVTPAKVSSGFSYDKYYIYSNMLTDKVCGEIEIPAFYIKNGTKYEKLKGYSWTTSRNQDFGFPQYKIDKMKIGTTQGPFSGHSLRGGYVPILIKTNTSDYGKEDLEGTIEISPMNKLIITDELLNIETHDFNPSLDKLYCYVRPCGVYRLTEGIPVAINYYKDAAVNVEKIKTAGYFTLSDENRGDNTPGCCLIGRTDKAVTAKATLQFKDVSKGGMYVYNIDRNCTVVNKGLKGKDGIVRGNVNNFPFKNQNQNTDIGNSIIATTNFSKTLAPLKNVADFASDDNHNRARISDGTGFTKDNFKTITRLGKGFNLEVQVLNMPYINVDTNRFTFKSTYTSTDDIKVADDVYAYCAVDRHFNSFHYFNMVLSANFKATPGIFPRSMSINSWVSEEVPEYKESSNKYTSISGMNYLPSTDFQGKDYEHTEEVLGNTGQYARKEGISGHNSVGGYVDGLDGFTKIGYFSEYVNYDTQTGMYLVLGKKLDCPIYGNISISFNKSNGDLEIIIKNSTNIQVNFYYNSDDTSSENTSSILATVDAENTNSCIIQNVDEVISGIPKANFGYIDPISEKKIITYLTDIT